MGRFIRDFSFLVSILLLPFGIYCLRAASDNRGPEAAISLLGGAALASGGLLGLYSSVREHFIMRDHIRYANGRRRQRTSGRAVRPKKLASERERDSLEMEEKALGGD